MSPALFIGSIPKGELLGARGELEFIILEGVYELKNISGVLYKIKKALDYAK
jgi:hypothetical protein